MCIPLVGRVLTVEENLASVELMEGQVAQANHALHPDVAVGEYVLLDRGLIVEVIDAEQANEILSFYTEMEQLWAEEEVRSD